MKTPLPPFGAKPIPTLPEYYATPEGDIYSLKGLRPRKMTGKIKKSKGYHVITLRRDGKNLFRFAHRLVLETFVGPCPEGCQTRHLDGNPLNNRLDNLVWGTKLENERDRIRMGRVPTGENNPAAKLTAAEVREIRRLAGTATHRELGKRFGVSKTTAGRIIRRQIWRAA